MAEEKILNSEDMNPKIYEIGYLLVPFIAEGDLSSTVTKEIKAVIEREGGVFTSELNPALRRLAYPIRKMIGNKHQVFRDAYFGALKFKAEPAAAVRIGETFRRSDMLVRFLLIQTKTTEVSARPHVYERPLAESTTAEASVVRAAEETPAAESTGDKTAIDKEIDDLLVASS